jgi:hypothetical protein
MDGMGGLEITGLFLPPAKRAASLKVKKDILGQRKSKSDVCIILTRGFGV